MDPTAGGGHSSDDSDDDDEWYMAALLPVLGAACVGTLWSAEVVRLTHDHDASDPVEQGGIYARVGEVVQMYGAWRTQGRVAVSRAVGDLHCRPAVGQAAMFARHPRRREDDFLILASDGLWKVVADQEAAAVAAQLRDNAEVAEWTPVHPPHRQPPAGTPAAPSASVSSVSSSSDGTPMTAAEALVRLARGRGSRDDVTVVVCFF